MADFKVSAVQPRESFSTQYGEMQSYALMLDGQTEWVKLNQKVETRAPEVGDTLTGEITTEQHKGQSYKKFKKVNPAYANTSGSAPAQPTVDNSQLEYITMMLEELTGRREVSPTGAKPLPPVEDDPFAGLDI